VVKERVPDKSWGRNQGEALPDMQRSGLMKEAAVNHKNTGGERDGAGQSHEASTGRLAGNRRVFKDLG